MPQPNYQFAKRQRELEKKRKKEQKALKKDAPASPADAAQPSTEDAPQVGNPTDSK